MAARRLIPAPKSLLHRLKVPNKLLTGPGPSSVTPRVLLAQAEPVIGHMHPEFFEIMDEVKAGVNYLFQTESPRTVVMPGTGNCAMEAAACNLLEPGDVALVAVNGMWADRFGEMARRQGAKTEIINREYGEAFTLEEIEDGLKKHKPKILFLTHAESSGGVLQPLEGVGELCHKHECLLIVDTVASLVGVPVHMDDWGIDYLYSGTQKAMGAPPGVAPVSLSDRAWHAIQNRKTKVSSFYMDLNELTNYWGCDDSPRRYHHTTPISTIYAMREAIAVIAEEGIENTWQRHKDICLRFQDEVKSIGLDFLCPDPAVRLYTVTAIKVPEGINWKQVVRYAADKYSMEIAGGLGAMAGKIWRIGLMGYNARPEIADLASRALREAVQDARDNPQRASEADAKTSW